MSKNVLAALLVLTAIATTIFAALNRPVARQPALTVPSASQEDGVKPIQ